MRKKFSQRALGLLRHVDPALAQPLQQIVGRQVDQLDLVGLVEHAVGHGLELAHAGDLRHDVAERLEVLHVEGRVDVDAGVEQLLDVLPALRVARRRIAAADVGVRELIDQQQLRLARERGVEIELASRRCRRA